MTYALAVLLASTVSLQPASYPTPAEAGFHHCALIYEKAVRDEAVFRPYVARWSDGHAQQWMFDSFLFLIQTSPSKLQTMTDPTPRSDWEGMLNIWFDPKRDLGALDGALESAKADLGPVPMKRQVMLMIPYPHPGMHAFGDVDGDGQTEDLGKPADRDKVLRWYVDESIRRFNAAKYKNLELWGFYWMREDMGTEDQLAVKAASRICHGKGKRVFWIPWYRAAGWDAWRGLGLDVCIMQPNYAFVSYGHGGRVRRNRLGATADLAKGKGLGVEIEAGNLIADAEDRRAFLHYLCDGARERYGYQQAATAYFLTVDLVGETAASKDPAIRATYDALADYIAGKSVADREPKCDWSVDGKPFAFGKPGVPSVVEGRLAKPTYVTDVEGYLEEPNANKPWRGVVRAEVKAPGGGDWQSVGWAVRTSSDRMSLGHQVVVVPVQAQTEQVRLRFESSEAGEGVALGSVGVKTSSVSDVRKHLAYGRTYTFEPRAKGRYDDDGSKLNDDQEAPGGFSTGKTVGWVNTNASVRFDLGLPMPISSIQVVCQGGGVGGVNWPAEANAYLSSSEPPPTSVSGSGTPPVGLVCVPPEPLQVLRTRSSNDQDGVIVFRPKQPAKARYVTLAFRSEGWLMLSEVRIASGGKNVARQSAYTLSPSPTVTDATDVDRPDDGERLTDGLVADTAFSRMVTGWTTAGPRTVTVDLGTVQPVGSVTVWSLAGGAGSVFAPKSVAIEVSPDGKRWYGGSEIRYGGPREDGTKCGTAPFTTVLPPDTRARWVRAKVEGARGWTMVSEIEVQPPSSQRRQESGQAAS